MICFIQPLCHAPFSVLRMLDAAPQFDEFRARTWMRKIDCSQPGCNVANRMYSCCALPRQCKNNMVPAWAVSSLIPQGLPRSLDHADCPDMSLPPSTERTTQEMCRKLLCVAILSRPSLANAISDAMQPGGVPIHADCEQCSPQERLDAIPGTATLSSRWKAAVSALEMWKV